MNSFNHTTSELDSSGTESVTSSPRYSIHDARDQRIRFMYSFGGKIVPRPHDNQLRYVGGETRIVAVNRSTSFSVFMAKLSKLSGMANVSVKYQLPNEDLDSLISVTTDEDMENMMEEYDRVASNQHRRSVRFRLFLFLKEEDPSRENAIASLLDGSTTRENWFFDALNSGSHLDGSRSEVSSVVSEIPDYLFGLENSGEAASQLKDFKKNRSVLQDSFSQSDPGSPAPVVSAAPAVLSEPERPTVDIKSENTNISPVFFPTSVESPPEIHPGSYSCGSSVQYVPAVHYSNGPPMPVFYIPSVAVPSGTVPIQAVQYMPEQYPGQRGQIPIIFHQPVPAMGQLFGGSVMTAVDGLDSYQSVAEMSADVSYGGWNLCPGTVSGTFGEKVHYS